MFRTTRDRRGAEHVKRRASGPSPAGQSLREGPRLAPLSFAIICVAVLTSPACTKPTAPTTKPLRVAAAADLAFAFKDIGAAFEARSGVRPTFSFGSTGLLAKQIAEGAPFDVFAAANVSFVEDVIAAGACSADSKSLYARGRIALWSRKGDLDPPPRTIADLTSPPIVKIAIANPEHAPYGRAAREALLKAGVWESVKEKLVYGENVQQTLQFAQSGNVEVAIVALSLAIVTEGGEYSIIEEKDHAPIDQALVVCGRGPSAGPARELALFIASKDGRAIMRRYGFMLPGESLAAAE